MYKLSIRGSTAIARPRPRLRMSNLIYREPPAWPRLHSMQVAYWHPLFEITHSNLALNSCGSPYSYCLLQYSLVQQLLSLYCIKQLKRCLGKGYNGIYLHFSSKTHFQSKMSRSGHFSSKTHFWSKMSRSGHFSNKTHFQSKMSRSGHFRL